MYWQHMPSTGTNYLNSGAAYGYAQGNLNPGAGFYQAGPMVPVAAQFPFEAPQTAQSAFFSAADTTPFPATFEGTVGTSTPFPTGEEQYPFPPHDDMYIAESQPRSVPFDYSFFQEKPPALPSLAFAPAEQISPDASTEQGFLSNLCSETAEDVPFFELDPSFSQAPQLGFAPGAAPAPSALTNERLDAFDRAYRFFDAAAPSKSEQPFNPNYSFNSLPLSPFSSSPTSTFTPSPISAFNPSPLSTFTSFSGYGGKLAEYILDPTPLEEVTPGIFSPNYSVVQDPQAFRPPPPLEIAPNELPPLAFAPEEIVTSTSRTTRRQGKTSKAAGTSRALKGKRAASPYPHPSSLEVAGSARWMQVETPETHRSRQSTPHAHSFHSTPQSQDPKITVLHRCVAPMPDSQNALCGMSLEGSTEFVNHLVEKHNARVNSKKPLFVCPLMTQDRVQQANGGIMTVNEVCGMSFPTKNGLRKHLTRANFKHIRARDVEVTKNADGTETRIEATTHLRCILCKKVLQVRRGGDFFSARRHLETQHDVRRPEGLTDAAAQAWGDKLFESVEIA